MADRTTYHPLSVLWHWLIAALIAAAYIIVFSMPESHEISPEHIRMINYHKWAGITVLFFSVLRIATRFVFAPPPLGAEVKMPAWQMLVHKLTLLGMLLLTLAVPLLGWLMSSAHGYQVVWLGVLPLPDLMGKNEALGHVLHEAHEVAAYTLLALVGLHTAAALKHQFIDKDGVLARMLPCLKK